jgi:hypothetical protein
VVNDVDVRRDALFDTIDRTDATPLRPGESRFEFLNRSASIFVRPIRELLQESLDHVPADARRDLVGALQGDNRQHESAFWELSERRPAFLREAFVGTMRPALRLVFVCHRSNRTSNVDALRKSTRGSDQPE